MSAFGGPGPGARPTGQWSVTWAAAGATALASLAISPTIQTGAWLAQCLLLIALIAGVGGLCRHLGAPRLLTSAATTLTALLVLTNLYLKDAAVAGVLPGPAAWRELRALVAQGADTVWAEAPPVPAVPGSTLFVVAGVALVAVLVDATAVTWRRAALAGLPLLGLYLVPAAVLEDGVPWPLFALSAVGWLLLLLVDSNDRLSRWGRALALRSGGPDSLPVHVGSTGRRLGAVAVLVAVGLPVLLPAFSEGILGNGSDGTGNGYGDAVRHVPTINPIVDLRRDLRQSADVEVLRYTTSDRRPMYLKLATLEVFDGTTWRQGENAASQQQSASAGLPAPPGLAPDVSATSVRTSVTVERLGGIQLPVPYPAQQVQIGGDWRYDSATLDVFSPTAGVSLIGTSYQVSSLAVRPTAAQLQAAGAPPASLSPLTLVPPSVKDLLSPIVQRIAGRYASTYEGTVALQNWLRSRFTYSLATPAGNSADDLAAFLRDRRGYCEQFSATLALMARVLGIPSRVVVGFAPGRPVASSPGTYAVSVRDAHAWPEMWFEGVGWVRFEPTPGGGDGVAVPAWAPPPISGPGSDATGGPSANGNANQRGVLGGRQVVPSGDERSLRRGAFGVPQPVTDLAPAEPASSGWWRLGLLLTAVALASAAVVPSAERTWRRRNRRQATGSAAVPAAWAEVYDTLVDLDLGPRVPETPRDVRRRLCGRGDFGPAEHAAVRRLTDRVERARYAPGSHGQPCNEAEAWRDATVITDRVLSSASRRAARRARWWPQSSRTRIAVRWGALGEAASQGLAAAVARLTGAVARLTGAVRVR